MLDRFCAGPEVNSDDRNLDIIVIGGSASADLAQWKSPQGQHPWLYEIVQNQVRTQVWRFSYKAVTNKTNKTRHWLQDSNELLRDIVSLPPDSAGRRVPPLFVAHSNGGITLKRALNAASHQMDQFCGLFATMRGIVFLSCPHPKQDDVTTWDNMNMIARAFESPLGSFVVLPDETGDLIMISHTFDRIKLKCSVINAFEIEPTLVNYKGVFNMKKKTNRILATEQLVQMRQPAAKHIAVRKSHMEICKLAPEDILYQEIQQLI